MKKYIIILLSFAPLFIQAQYGSEKAQNQLKSLAQTLQSAKNIRIQFTLAQNTEKASSSKSDAEKTVLSQPKQGILWISENKFRLMLDGQIIINDGKTLYTYLPQANEIQINDASASENELNPLTLLKTYQQNYRSKYIREENGYLIVDLLPLNENRFYKIRLEISTSNNSPRSISLYDRNGNTTTYQIDKFELNKDVDPSIFTFNPDDYKNAEVVDLR